MTDILIASYPEDLHAAILYEALVSKGANPHLWMTTDYPVQATETVHYRGRRETIYGDALRSTDRIVGKEMDHREFVSIWHRRALTMWGESPTAPEDFEFSLSQGMIAREGLLRILDPNSFWVNPPGSSSRVRSKVFQHHVAAGLGLEMPETLYSNDPSAIRAFVASREAVIYKPFHPKVWREEDTSFGIYTSTIEETDLVADSLLRACPGIYQERVEKKFELRVTAIGNRIFAAKILTHELPRGKVDWRRETRDLRMEPFELPAEIETLCQRLMDALGLVFGCIDFIVTPEDRYVFLEVNQMGQFLFVERLCGYPLADAFCAMLMQGTSAYEWDPASADVSSVDLRPAAIERLEGWKKQHARRPTDGLPRRYLTF